MEDTTDEASIATENTNNNSPTKERQELAQWLKMAKRTFPLSITAEINVMLPVSIIVATQTGRR
jgi:hypothetical protein